MYMVTRTYPLYPELRKKLPEHEIGKMADCTVNLEITTEKKLPEAFFNELQVLIAKHSE